VVKSVSFYLERFQFQRHASVWATGTSGTSGFVNVCPQSAKGDASRATTQSDSPGGSTGPGAKSDVYD